jgi:catechol 2,3-dioxygenase-like lactoylglutathione lyase family enzyme
MAPSSILNPAFAYTVLYVKDVAESVDFYAKAFGYSVRRLDESHRLISFISFISFFFYNIN